MQETYQVGHLTLTYDQFVGNEPLYGVYLTKLTEIPEGFNPTVIGTLHMPVARVVPKGFNPKVTGDLYLSRVVELPEDFAPLVTGSLHLDNVTELPRGFNPTVGRSLLLGSLKEIPEWWIKPVVPDWLNLNSVYKVPPTFKPIVGGRLDLPNAIDLPDDFGLVVGGGLDLRSIYILPRAFHPTVGGTLNLFTVKGLHDGFKPKVQYEIEFREINPDGASRDQWRLHNERFLSWDNGKYIKVDGIFSEVVKQRKNVWHLKDVGTDKHYFLVSDGKGKFAHGNTIDEARSDLVFKIADVSKGQYVGLKLDSKLSFQEAVTMYRVVTGACEFGVKQFVENYGIEKRTYSVAEIVELTVGHYGHSTLTEFLMAA